jgi:dTDP-4-amino-4,6-dideoxygalactose transaminase
MTVRIPLAKPEITDADREAVMEVLRTPYLSSGPKVEEFERAVCDYTRAKHAVAVNSGTSALQLAIRALGIERGAEVLLPSFTFSAVLNVILLEGLRPRFVDIDPRTYNCSAESILAAVTENTRLIIAVHTFGFPQDVAAIIQGLSRRSWKNKIHVIEDACEALGADVHGRKAGTLADAGLFAFYPNKQITTGEGGMLVTSHEKVARKAAQLRNQGRDPALGWNSHAEIGFSYRISDINCALGISQLARMEDIINGRQKIAEAYERELSNIQEIVRPSLTSDVGRISWFVYPIQLSAEFTAAERHRICESMLQKGIGTGKYFAPLHRQPVLQKSLKTFTTEDAGLHRGNATEETVALPMTELVADRVIQLPFFNELNKGEIQEVCRALKDAIQDARRNT